MKRTPIWFYMVVVLALIWNLAGVFAVGADLALSASDIAAMSPAQQAMYAARPVWSVVGSILAVAGGTLGCLALLVRHGLALALLYGSLIGIVLQDLGLFVVAGVGGGASAVAAVMQGMVLVIAIGLIALTRYAMRQFWRAGPDTVTES